MPEISVKPFPIDPNVMSKIRPMLQRDLSRVVALHKAMGRSLWARLGTEFLMTLYHGLLAHPDFVGFVYEEPPRVKGMIAGTSHGKKMFREVLADNRRRLAGPAFMGILSDPRVAWPLLTTSAYFKLSRAPAEDILAESMFCSFEPEVRGTRISGHINKVLFDELFHRGHRYVKVTTEADNQGANRQLTSWGFKKVGSFHFYAKPMVVYVLDMEASDRVAPVSRYPGPDLKIVHGFLSAR